MSNDGRQFDPNYYKQFIQDVGPSYRAAVDIDNPDFTRQWNSMLRNAQGVADSVASRSVVAQVNEDLVRRKQPLDDTQSGMLDWLNKRVASEVGRIGNDPITPNEYDDLLGQAKMRGIQSPESMDPRQLLVEVHRRQMSDYLGRVEGGELDRSAAQKAGDLAKGFLGNTLFGVPGNIIDIARNIPFAGDWLSKHAAVQNADQWFAKMQEGFRYAGPDDVSLADKAQGWLNTGVGYLIPSGLLFKGLARVGIVPTAAQMALGPTMPLIMRGALASGIDATMFMGGGDDPIEDRAFNIIAATGLGAAATAGLSAYMARGARLAAAKARNSFLTISDPETVAPPIVDADWSFDEPVTAGRRALGPGPAGLPEPSYAGDLVAGDGSALPPGQYTAPGAVERGAFAYPGGPVDVEGTPPLDFGNLGTFLERSQPAEEAALNSFVQRTDPFYATPGGQAFRDFDEGFLQDFVQRTEPPGPPPSASGVRVLDPARQPATDALTSVGATHDAAQYAKQQMVVGSPALPELSAKPRYGDVDAIRGQVATNPGRSILVGAISDPLGVVSDLHGMGIDPESIAVTTRNGVPHVLVGPPEKVQSMAADFAEHGVFEGQQVGASEVKFVEPDGTATVETLSGVTQRVPAAGLAPHNVGAYGETTQSMTDGMYWTFRDFARTKMETEVAGLSLSATPDWFSNEMSTMLPSYLDEFMDAQGITSEAGRALMIDRFSANRAKDAFELLSPGEAAILDNLRMESAFSPDGGIQSLDDMAAARGFSVEHYTGGNKDVGFATLRRPDGTHIPMETEAAAREFLRGYDLPHGQPGKISAAPVELLDMPQNPATSNNRTLHDTSGHIGKAVQTEVNSLEDDLFERGGGGGGLPPAQPPFGTLPPPGPGSSISPHVSREQVVDVGGMIGSRANTLEMAKLEELADGLYYQWIAPTNSMISLIEEHLTGPMGIQGATAWRDVEAVRAAKRMSTNMAQPWLEDVQNILKKVRLTISHKGAFFEAMETSFKRLPAVMEKHGFTQSEKEAVGETRVWLAKLRAIAGQHGIDVPEISYYMPHYRKFMQHQKLDMVPKEIQWIAEHMRENGIDDLNVDANIILEAYAKGLANRIHVKGPYETAMAVWDDKRIPEFIRNPVTNYIRDTTFGAGRNVGQFSRAAATALDLLSKPLGLRILPSDTRRILSTLQKFMYTGFLSQPYNVIRDHFQPLSTGAEIGMEHVLGAYRDMYHSVERNRAMWNKALEHAWVERGAEYVPNADIFQPAGTVADVSRLSTDLPTRDRELARREAINGAWLKMLDAFPMARRLADAMRWNPLMKPYNVVNEANRVIAGWAGYNRATEAIAMHWSGDGPKVMTNLLDAAGVNSYRQPVRATFQSLVEQGKLEEAAGFLGRQAADSQHLYGRQEFPQKFQAMGDPGRTFMSLGMYATNQAARVKEHVANIPGREAFKYVGRTAIVGGVVATAAAITGMRGLGKYFFAGGMGFTGGPTFQAAQDVATVVSGGLDAIGGGGGDPRVAQAKANLSMDNPLNLVNPARGVMSAVEGVGQAVRGPMPVRQFMAEILTGQGGSAQFFQNGTQTPAGEDFLQGLMRARELSGQSSAPIQSPSSPKADPPPQALDTVADLGQHPMLGEGQVAVAQGGYLVYKSPSAYRDGQPVAHRLDDIAQIVPQGMSVEQYEESVLQRPTDPQDTTSINDIDALQPDTADKVHQLINRMAAEGHRVQTRETLRTQSRQEYLFKIGRSTPGNPVTWTLTSNHRSGRAADFFVDGDQSGNSPGYKRLWQIAGELGLNTLGPNDPGHVEDLGGTVSNPLAMMVGRGAM